MNPGSQLGKRRNDCISINYPKNRAEFIEYLESKNHNQRYSDCLLSYLDKNVSTIEKPMDVVRIFSKLTTGQQHNLIRAMRAFLNFMEINGIDPMYLNSLRKAIPKDNTGIDLRVPLENEIVASLKRLPKMPLKYQAVYNLLLDSGLRLTEAVKLINEFENVTEINGFYRCTLGYFRGNKMAYAAYFTASTLALVEKISEELQDTTTSHYFVKTHVIAPKYLRKFAFDSMISERINIPESVADFIEGRVPQKIGARHYTKLLKQADGYYNRYAEYVGKIRAY